MQLMQAHLYLERWITESENRLAQAFSRLDRKLFCIAASLLLLGVEFLFFQERFPMNWYNQFIFPPLYARILIACPLFPLFPILAEKLKKAGELLCLLLFVISPSIFHVGTSPHFPYVSLAAVAVFYLVVLLNLGAARFKIWYPVGATLGTTLFVAVLDGVIRITGLSMDVYQIFLPPTERVAMLCSPLRGSKLFRRYVLSPVQLIYPVPYFEETRPSDESIVKIKAVMNVFIALSLFALGAVFGFLLSKIRPITIGNRWLTLLLAGWINYLYYYANSIGLITVATSFLQLSGFNVVEGAFLPLLASNPADRWRRWNIPFYNWFFLHCYLPSFRKYRKHFVAVMWTFLITWFFHRWSEVIYGVYRFFIVRQLTSEIWHQYFLSNQMLIFFLMHGLVVYLAIRFPRLFPRTILGVALTHFLMALVHVEVL